MKWEVVIGLEVHTQLSTQSKIFSGSSTAFGAAPNTQASAVDIALPGVLPVMNRAAVDKAIRFGLAIGAKINRTSIFARKNYFYPDLPKGYQISQFELPIVEGGSLQIQVGDSEKTVNLTRAHLEEDAGKSLHEDFQGMTGIDLNRAGTPLLEIVSEPDMRSAAEAVAYARALYTLVTWLGMCDGNMQEGSFRCDVNISLKPKGSQKLGVRTELKNLNSFKYIEKAIAYECWRHQEILESGGTLKQETRLYNPESNRTQAMREKEFENDYRYFPDPDLLPIEVTRYQIAAIKASIPDLPAQISEALRSNPALNEEDIQFILSSPEAYYFFKAVKKLSHCSEKLLINWLKGPYIAALNEQGLSFTSLPVKAASLALLLDRLEDKIISSHQAKIIFTKLWQAEEDIDALIHQAGFNAQQDTGELEALVQAVINQFPSQVADYKSGKEKLLGFFVGNIMKQTKGQANPELVTALVKKLIG